MGSRLNEIIIIYKTKSFVGKKIKGPSLTKKVPKTIRITKFGVKEGLREEKEGEEKL